MYSSAAVSSFAIRGGADALSLSPFLRCICADVLTFVVVVLLYRQFDGVVCCYFQFSVFADYENIYYYYLVSRKHKYIISINTFFQIRKTYHNP